MSLSLETVQIDSPKLMESKRFLLGIYGGEATKPVSRRKENAGWIKYVRCTSME